MRLFDSHAHFDDDRFKDDQKEIITDLSKHNVVKVISVGADIDSSLACIKLANTYDNIYATAGVHPHDAKSWNTDSLSKIKEMLTQEKVVALGEIGLDYHYDFSPRDMQMKCMMEQLGLLEYTNKSVIYHIREAWGDFMPLVGRKMVASNAVMHCYSGSREIAKQLLDAGMMISFTGVITFKNANSIREVVKYVPMESIMIETDCPYMAPTPYRGKRNESAYVIEVARTIAKVKKLNLEDVAEITYQNAINFFDIKD